MSVDCRVVRAVVAVGILAAACGGQSGVAPGPRPDAPSGAAPVSRAPARVSRSFRFDGCESPRSKVRPVILPTSCSDAKPPPLTPVYCLATQQMTLV